MNKNIIIAVLVAALAGTGYYAYTEHQQVQDLQAQVDSTKKKLAQVQVNATDLQAQVKDLQSKNDDLQDQIDSQPAPAAQSGVSVSDLMRQMDEDDLRQKESEYLDKVNRKLDDEYWGTDVKMQDFTK